MTLIALSETGRGRSDRGPDHPKRGDAARITVPEALAVATALFSTLRTDRYAATLVDALRSVAPFDFFAVVHYPNEGTPVFLTDNLGTATSAEVIENYVAGGYLLDVAYAACRNGVAAGLHRIVDLAPDDFFLSEFSSSENLHPCVSAGCLAEELVFIDRLPDASGLVLSLMRGRDRERFDHDAFASLSALDGVVRETMAAHWRDACRGPDPRATRPAGELEQAFSAFAKDRLSLREQNVVSLLLRGHSALSVAHNLRIAEGTVRIHRKHIYEKLGINSQAQLFLLFCEHIMRERRQGGGPDARA